MRGRRRRRERGEEGGEVSPPQQFSKVGAYAQITGRRALLTHCWGGVYTVYNKIKQAASPGFTVSGL